MTTEQDLAQAEAELRLALLERELLAAEARLEAFAENDGTEEEQQRARRETDVAKRDEKFKLIHDSNAKERQGRPRRHLREMTVEPDPHEAVHKDDHAEKKDEDEENLDVPGTGPKRKQVKDGEGTPMARFRTPDGKSRGTGTYATPQPPGTTRNEYAEDDESLNVPGTGNRQDARNQKKKAEGPTDQQRAELVNRVGIRRHDGKGVDIEPPAPDEFDEEEPAQPGDSERDRVRGNRPKNVQHQQQQKRTAEEQALEQEHQQTAARGKRRRDRDVGVGHPVQEITLIGDDGEVRQVLKDENQREHRQDIAGPPAPTEEQGAQRQERAHRTHEGGRNLLPHEQQQAQDVKKPRAEMTYGQAYARAIELEDIPEEEMSAEQRDEYTQLRALMDSLEPVRRAALGAKDDEQGKRDDEMVARALRRQEKFRQRMESLRRGREAESTVASRLARQEDPTLPGEETRGEAQVLPTPGNYDQRQKQGYMPGGYEIAYGQRPVSEHAYDAEGRLRPGSYLIDDEQYQQLHPQRPGSAGRRRPGFTGDTGRYGQPKAATNHAEDVERDLDAIEDRLAAFDKDEDQDEEKERLIDLILGEADEEDEGVEKFLEIRHGKRGKYCVEPGKGMVKCPPEAGGNTPSPAKKKTAKPPAQNALVKRIAERGKKIAAMKEPTARHGLTGEELRAHDAELARLEAESARDVEAFMAQRAGKAPEQKPAEKKPAKPAANLDALQARAEQARAGKLSDQEREALRGDLMKLTVAQLDQVRQRLGLKGGGRKKDDKVGSLTPEPVKLPAEKPAPRKPPIAIEPDDVMPAMGWKKGRNYAEDLEVAVAATESRLEAFAEAEGPPAEEEDIPVRGQQNVRPGGRYQIPGDPPVINVMPNEPNAARRRNAAAKNGKRFAEPAEEPTEPGDRAHRSKRPRQPNLTQEQQQAAGAADAEQAQVRQRGRRRRDREVGVGYPVQEVTLIGAECADCKEDILGQLKALGANTDALRGADEQVLQAILSALLARKEQEDEDAEAVALYYEKFAEEYQKQKMSKGRVVAGYFAEKKTRKGLTPGEYLCCDERDLPASHSEIEKFVEYLAERGVVGHAEEPAEPVGAQKQERAYRQYQALQQQEQERNAAAARQIGAAQQNRRTAAARHEQRHEQDEPPVENPRRLRIAQTWESAQAKNDELKKNKFDELTTDDPNQKKLPETVVPTTDTPALAVVPVPSNATASPRVMERVRRSEQEVLVPRRTPTPTPTPEVVPPPVQQPLPRPDEARQALQGATRGQLDDARQELEALDPPTEKPSPGSWWNQLLQGLGLRKSPPRPGHENPAPLQPREPSQTQVDETTPQERSQAEVVINYSRGEPHEKQKQRTHAMVKKIFGADATPERLAELVGAPHDSQVYIDHVGHFGGKKYGEQIPMDAQGVWVSIAHPGVKHATRFIGIDARGRRFVYNSAIETEKSHRGSDLVPSMVARQVEAAGAAGFDYMVADAVREQDAAGNNKKTGYNVWPKYGFDLDLSDANLNRMSKVYSAQELMRLREARDKFKAKSVIDVLNAPGGREWWAQNGVSVLGSVFDLRPGSKSMRQLRKYLASKKQPAEAKQMADKPKDKRDEDENEVVDEFGHTRRDLRLLDEAMEAVAREDREALERGEKLSELPPLDPPTWLER